MEEGCLLSDRNSKLRMFFPKTHVALLVYNCEGSWRCGFTKGHIFLPILLLLMLSDGPRDHKGVQIQITRFVIWVVGSVPFLIDIYISDLRIFYQTFHLYKQCRFYFTLLCINFRFKRE